MVGELQSGKTAAQIVTMLALPVFWRELGAKNPLVGVVYITNKSLLSIFDQTKDRLEEAGIESMPFSDDSSRSLWSDSENLWVAPIMLSGTVWDADGERGKFVDAMNDLRAAGCTHFAFVMDEVQIAIKNNQQIDRFFREYLDIQVPTSSAESFNPPTVFIGSTATPHNQFVVPAASSQTLQLVYTEPGEGYFGIEQMVPRMKHTDPLTEVDDVVSLLRKYVRKIDPKYFVVRIQAMRKSVNEEALYEEAAERLGMKVIKFSANERNLQELPKRFKRKPDQNVLIIIKNGLGAGVTIKTVEHIGAWIDTAYVQFEALLQSLGRLCGYQEDRQLAEFPIFCNTELVEQYLTFIRLTRDGITPSFNEISEIIGSNARVRMDWLPIGDRATYRLGTLADFKRVARKGGWYDAIANKDEHGRRGRRVRMEHNHVADIAQFILNGSITTSPLAYIVPHRPPVGSPSKFFYSWRKLNEKFPELKGRSDLVFFMDDLEFKTRVTGKRKAMNAIIKDVRDEDVGL